VRFREARLRSKPELLSEDTDQVIASQGKSKTLKQPERGSREAVPEQRKKPATPKAASAKAVTAAQRSPAAKKGANGLASAAPVRSRDFALLRQVMWSRPGFMVRRLHQIGDALFYEECQSNSITPVQFGVLTALSMNPWLDQKAIGRELALDRTTTAEVLRRLEEKGLIERRVNRDDRRSRLSVITRQGLETVGALHEGMQSAQDRLIAPLSKADRATFFRLVSQIVEAHERMDSAS
jgi:DNA-binding MarR family transcriptional regulator